MMKAEKILSKKNATAILRKFACSARKTRLVADLIRGHRVSTALNLLDHNYKRAAIPVKKLILSSVANWKKAHNDNEITNDDLFVSSIMVGEAGMLKRIKPAPQGRAHRIRKRLSHVTLVVSEILEGVVDSDSNKTGENSKKQKEAVSDDKKKTGAKQKEAGDDVVKSDIRHDSAKKQESKNNS